MRALVQRVSRAVVSVGAERIAQIGQGLVVLVGIARGDTPKDAAYLVDKIAHLRIFPDSEGRFDLSALDVRGELLLVSQFTLLADTRKGRRPSFAAALPAEEARPLFSCFVDLARQTGLGVQTGLFQEHMKVEIYNDGPVSIVMDSAGRHRPRSSEGTAAEGPTEPTPG